MEELSDKEQLDAMRSWWADNGNYVLGGIAVGVIVLFGWNRWQSGMANAEIAASGLYEDVMDAAARGQLEAAAEPATELVDDYPESPYALHARLAMARLYMDNSRDQDAVNMLQEVVSASSDEALAMIARVRLAKVYLYQGKAEEALGLVKDQPPSAFAASYSEIMGDAYASMGSYDEAQAAYILALNDDPQAPTVDLDLIQLKLNDLPAAGDMAALVEAEDAGTAEIVEEMMEEDGSMPAGEDDGVTSPEANDPEVSVDSVPESAAAESETE